MSFSEVAGNLLSNMGPGLLSGLGKELTSKNQPQTQEIPNAPDPKKPTTAKPNHFKNGGVVQKTGVALVHKGETVIPAHHEDHEEETVHLSHHRVLMHLHKGGLHRALGIPEGQKIPEDKLQSARNSNNPHVRAMANLANTMKGWKH